MATCPIQTKFSEAPEVAGFDGIEASRPGQYNRSFEQKEALAPERRTICGLRRPTFFLSFALAIVVVLAAAVGGGVGASACNSKKSVGRTQPAATSTMTVTSTLISATASTSSSAPATSPSITTTCPFSNNTVYHSLFKTGSNGAPGSNAGLDYIIYCNMNFVTGLGPHLAQVYAISFDDCIEACASYNFWGDTTDCEQVAYKLDGSRPGNCWIGTKNASEALTFEASPLDIAFLQ